MPKFFGWYLAVCLWLMLIAAIGGSVYAWGFYAPEVMKEIGLTAAEIGGMSGAMVIIYSLAAPIAGYLIGKFGCRFVMPFGAMGSALGCYVIANANELWHFFLGLAVLINGFGSLNGSLAAQTLVTSWFKKYRARVLAFMSTAISLGGFIWYRIHDQILQTYDWRTGWMIACYVSIALAVIAILLVRDRPETIGQLMDGERDETMLDGAEQLATVATDDRKDAMSLRKIWARVTSPQFIILVLVGVVLVAPSGLIVVHGRLHLEGLGLTQAQAVNVLSISALVGLTGRIMSGLGDLVHPKVLLMGAVIIQALGTFGMIFAGNLALAYLSVGAIGIGIGAGMQTIAVLIGRYFGREAFSSTQGLRTFAAGAFNATIPWAVGLSADLTGNYSLALSVEGCALILIGVVAALFLKDVSETSKSD